MPCYHLEKWLSIVNPRSLESLLDANNRLNVNSPVRPPLSGVVAAPGDEDASFSAVGDTALSGGDKVLSAVAVGTVVGDDPASGGDISEDGGVVEVPPVLAVGDNAVALGDEDENEMDELGKYISNHFLA